MTTHARRPAATGRPFSPSPRTAAPLFARADDPDSRVHRGREALVVLGIAWAALALPVAVWPGRSVATLELLFGLVLALGAGAQIFLAAGARFATPLRVLLVVCGLISAGFALMCVSGGNSVPMLSMWLGIGWATTGIGLANVAVWDDELARPLRHELVGLAVLFAGVLLLLLPLDSVTALAMVAAAAMILLGAAHVLLAGVGRGEVVPAWTRRIRRPARPVAHRPAAHFPNPFQGPRPASSR
ncbi:DUF308 domain-containing protein [Nocardia bovistercoris]|uniref:DUF308 domain-containing protein n=1 Tax=Nocardia bovistercoris TaxID=2785916 RepID=A0A931N029_9NOCA|nr:DUF308 domain-containing protein [Nocardia bovistercoris]MBH0776795.1 DUF308 domain-containing protein [Nocardia bovistercoris]